MPRRLVFLAVLPVLAASAASASEPLFRDQAAELGLVFRHFNGMTGDYLFPEMTGQGGALFDYDNDGDLDVYLVQGGMLGPGKTLADALEPPPPGSPLGDRLFRNDLGLGPDGRPRPRFVDVTEASGIMATGYGMGAAAGDMDNDGWTDLYVTNYGANQLWRNLGDGTFAEEAASRGVADEGWSTSAAWADLDADGWLDLYVVNYVDFDIVANPACYATSTRRDYCGPDAFTPQADRLFLNGGSRTGGAGHFADETTRRLRDYRPGPGLGVVAADFDGDGRLDLFVANDGRENQLWQAGGDGTFTDEALFAGVAVNREGRAEASMGVAVGDYDADGDLDLFVTHLMGETNTLYVNDSGLFEDRTLETGLAGPSSRYTAFGTVPLDYDNDGYEDLLALNGAVRILEAQAAAGDLYPLRQPNQLFRNLGGRFVELTNEAGAELMIPEVSRGAAAGDVDNDGDTDAVVFNNSGPARLLINQAGQRAAWVGWRAETQVGGGSRPALGARVLTTPADGPPRFRRVATDGSYCAASDPRGVAGLGAGGAAAELRLDWLEGGAVRWIRPATGRYLVIRREVGRMGTRE